MPSIDDIAKFLEQFLTGQFGGSGSSSGGGAPGGQHGGGLPGFDPHMLLAQAGMHDVAPEHVQAAFGQLVEQHPQLAEHLPSPDAPLDLASVLGHLHELPPEVTQTLSPFDPTGDGGGFIPDQVRELADDVLGGPGTNPLAEAAGTAIPDVLGGLTSPIGTVLDTSAGALGIDPSVLPEAGQVLNVGQHLLSGDTDGAIAGGVGIATQVLGDDTGLPLAGAGSLVLDAVHGDTTGLLEQGAVTGVETAMTAAGIPGAPLVGVLGNDVFSGHTENLPGDLETAAIETGFTAAGAAAGSVLGPLGTVAGGAVGNFIGQEAAPTIEHQVSDVVDGASNTVEDIGNTASNVGDDISSGDVVGAAGDIAQGGVAVVGDAADTAVNVVGDGAQGVADLASDVGDAAGSVISDVGDTLSDLF